MDAGLVLFLLLAGHFVADYTLQSDFIAANKNRKGPNIVPWYYVLTAHSATHGFIVAMVTQVWWLGFAEMTFHALSDFLKSENKISHNEDQIFHILCKLAWFILFLFFSQ